MLELVALLAVAAPLTDTVPIQEWLVPWEKSRPRDPFMDSRGRVWFVGQVGNYIAYLTPSTGDFKRYDIDEGVHPHNLIVAPDGMVWYAGNQAAHIGKLDPATGKVTKYPMPDPAARDPHTLVFAPDGNIWFTLQQAGMVGHLNTKSGDVKLTKMPRPNARPYGIVVDESGRPWFCEFGTHYIGTLDPKTFELKEYELPNATTRPRRMARTADGIVWYVDYSRGYLGRLDPKTGAVKEWPNPSGARSLPYGMMSDDLGRLWFVETGVQPNQLVGFDPATEEFFSMTKIPGGGGTIRHMSFHAPTRTIWYGADNNQIGKITVPPRRPATLTP